MTRAHRRWLLALALAAGACAGAPAPVDHYYSLVVAAPADRDGIPLRGTLHVDRLRTDALIGQRHLLYRERAESAEIRQLNYHRWNDPPAVALQTALIDFLRESGVANVMEAGARTRPDYTISGRLRRFEQVLDDDPRVVVELDLSVTRSNGDLIVDGSYSEQRPASGISAAAEAMGEAVRAIFERFVADLRRADAR